MFKRYLALALIVLALVLRLTFGVPAPTDNDISAKIPNLLSLSSYSQVKGVVDNRPKFKFNQYDQPQFTFILDVDEVNQQNVVGKTWVTAYLDDDCITDYCKTKGFPQKGDLVSLEVKLNFPKNFKDSKFDFVTYLKRKGIFSTAYGELTNVVKMPPSLLVSFQSYLLEVQSRWVNHDVASLQLAMVVGDEAVELSDNLTKSFRTVGLTHIMVVSGFQVVLILSLVNKLTENKGSWFKFNCLLGTALTFLTITGIQPSIARAVVMGLLPYLAQCFNCKAFLVSTKPIYSVFLSAGILLLIAPMWIYQLGFQLSFLATLGLVTCTDWLINKLNFLPKFLAELIAVPIVASVWVQPLILSTFGTFPTYGLITNIISAPIVQVITITGFITTIISLIPIQPFILISQGLAFGLSYITGFLISLVNFFSNLPFPVLSFELPLIITIIIYLSLFTTVFKQKHTY